MTQLVDLDSLCVSTGYPSGMRPVRLGAGRGARGGEGGASARAPGVLARVLFLGFFFLHAELQGPQIEKQAVFPQKTGLSRKHRFTNENRGAGRRFLVPCWAVRPCRASTSLAPLYPPCASPAFNWGSKRPPPAPR
jgi:hypothetical protein